MRKLFAAIFIFILVKSLAAQNIDPYFCTALKRITTEADSGFKGYTYLERFQYLSPNIESRFDLFDFIPGFAYGKIVNRHLYGLYYETLALGLDSAGVHDALAYVDKNILACYAPAMKRRPQTDTLTYSYYRQYGDTLEDVFIKMEGVYPSMDADSFYSPGQVTLTIYGDIRRRFVPYKPDPKKKNTVLAGQLAQIEKGLLDNIKTIQGEATKDVNNEEIWIAKVKPAGAAKAFVKTNAMELTGPYVYYAEFYNGHDLAAATKVYNTWKEKLKNNVFTEKRFSAKNRKKLQWVIGPYQQYFDPDVYADIVEQTAFVCPEFNEEPSARSPLFAYHLFILRYIDSYIVAVSVGDRF